MAETLTVQITAQDGATRVFKAVEGSAASMGKAVEAAGKSGTTGIRSLTQELQRLDSEISTVGTAMVGLGAAITGALALPLAKGTKAAWDQVSAVEQATFALGAYGDSAEDVNAALQDLTRYAQDASRSGGIFWSQDLFYAAQTLRTLGAELDNVSEYVQIMSRSVGIGAGSWDRLLEVIGRVGATSKLTALDIDELAKMGFQLDRSLAGMTVTWDELFAILDRGIPADALLGQADTIQGALLYLEGALVNLGQAFLGVDEQFQFIAGGLGDQMVQGIRSVTESINDLAPAATAFGSGVGTVVTGVFKLVEAFNALPGPIQQSIALTTGAAGAFTLAAGSMLLMINPAIRVVRAMRTLAATSAGVKSLELGLAALRSPLGAITGAAALAAYGITQMYQNTRDMVGASKELDEVWRDLMLSGRLQISADLEEAREQINGIINDLEGAGGLLPWSTGIDVPSSVKEGISDVLNQAVTDARIDYEKFFNWIESEIERIGNDPDAQIDFLRSLSDPNILIQFRREVDGTTGAVNILTAGLEGLNRAGTATMRALREEADGTAESFAAMAQTLYQLETDLVPTSAANAISIVTDGLNAIPPAAQKAGNAIFDMVSGTAQTQLDEFTASAENIRSLLDSMGMTDPLALWNLSGHASDVMALTQETLQFGQALDSVLGIYGQIDAMSQRMSSAGGIADALFGPDGDPYDAIGPMRDVFDAGLISLEQFNAAIEDGIAIQERAAESELYLNKIRVDQLPILRETTDAYAEQIRLISEMDPQEQLVALGWMDEALQGQVQNFTDLVSEMNNFGDAGQDAIQGVIDRIAATDPVLTAMLEDLGLIEQQMDGSYTLSIDAGDAISDMERLNVSIGHLIDTINNDELGTYALDVQTSVNGEPTGPEGIAGLLSDAIGNVTGGEAGIDVPVRPSLPDNAAADLRNALSADPVEIEIAPVIQAGMDWLSGGIGALLGGDGGPQDTTITIDAVDNATPVIDGITAQLTALGAWDATIDISAPNAYTTIGDLNGVQSAAEAVPDSVTTWTLAAGYVEAIGALNGVQAAAEAIPNSVTTVISAVDNASAVIGDAVSFLASVDGYTSTMTLNVVTNQITRTSSQRHGGIPGFASGGVLFEGGEAGLEVAHFANGGMAILPHHALYTAPSNTYISPANANEGVSASVAPQPVNVHIHGNFYGTNEMIDAMAAAAEDFFAGRGGGA